MVGKKEEGIFLNREEALELVKENVRRRNMIYHMLAVEAIMKAIARYLKEDEALWGLTGVLHDIDFEETREKPEKHGLIAESILDKTVPEEVIRCIKAHNYRFTGVKPETRMEKALIAGDAVSGLVIACALVMPSKKIRDVRLETIKKKFRDKDFARGADRNRIKICEELGITTDDFFEIALESIKEIAGEIGL
ncbi:MAG: HDIG domain-containing metalloprotein [Candidatus Bathyarchaeia archaeon]